MKIVFFNYLLLEYGGGTAEYFIDIAREIKSRHKSSEVIVLTLNEKLSRRFLTLYSLYFMKHLHGQKILKESQISIKKRLSGAVYKQADNITELKKELSDADVIYCKNDLLELMLLNLLTGELKSKKVIIGFHTPSVYEKTTSFQATLHNFFYSSIVYTHLLRHADILHVLNSSEEKALRERFPDKKILKIPNPYDFTASESIAKNSGVKNFSILWVGRLTEQKGIDDLIKLIHEFNTSPSQTPITWTIIGDGEYKDTLVTLQEKWGNVTVLGHVTRQKLLRKYSQFNLFLSTSKWESFPYTLLEAQGAGLPVLCYDIHGCNDIITSGKNGYLAVDYASLSKTLRKILDNPGQVIKKTIVKRYIRKKYDSKKIYSELSHMITL